MMTNSSGVIEKIKVLLIGGTEHNAFTIINYLERHRDEIDFLGWAKTGQESISKIQILKPDVVLVDVHMPDMNSVDIVRLIRASSKSIKIVTMSESNNPQWIMSTIEAGADHYISQPMLGIGSDAYILMDNMYNVIKSLYYHIGVSLREEMNKQKGL